MGTILISRGTIAGGKEVSECMERQGGLRCLTREDLVSAVTAQGEAAAKVLTALPRAVHAYQEFSALRRPYKILMRLAMLEAFSEGHCAYLGYSGHLLLPNFPQYLRVRLLAPPSYRLERTMKFLDLEKEEAQDYIRRVDQERLTWCRFMYGKDLRDPMQYDLCINMSKASVKDVCAILLDSFKKETFQDTAESVQHTADFLLATRVLAGLVLDAETRSLELGATAKKGDVLIEGPYLEKEKRDRVIEKAEKIDGVTTVEYKPGYCPIEDFGV